MPPSFMSYGDQSPVWSEAQLLSAGRVIHQVRQHGGGQPAAVIALAVALVESDLLVLSSDKVPQSKASQYVQGNAAGDHLSVGLFQQQPWWGPTAKLMNPWGATQRFLTGGDDGSHGLYDILGWEALGDGEAATRVQRNASGAHPYAARTADAGRLCRLLWPGT